MGSYLEVTITKVFGSTIFLLGFLSASLQYGSPKMYNQKLSWREGPTAQLGRMGGVLNAASQGNREHIASLQGTLQNCTSMREIWALFLQEQTQAESAGLYPKCNY